MRTIILIALTAWLHIANAGQDVGLTIHSIDVAETALEQVPVTIEYSYDGKSGRLLAAIYAGAGPDWAVLSRGYVPGSFETGVHQKTTVTVSRPMLAEATRTDRISVAGYRGGQFPLVRKIFDRPIEWGMVPTIKHYGKYPNMVTAAAYDVDDYAEIDNIINYWMKTSRFNSHGDWNIDSFFDAFAFRFGHDRAGSLKKIRKWRLEQPRSRNAALAEAAYWVHYAIYLRGYVRLGQVLDEDTLFVVRKYHAKAEKVLADSKAYASGVPLWYGLRLKMAINGAEQEAVIKKVFEDGVRAFPQYQTLYIDMAAHLVRDSARPRWTELMELADRLDKATLHGNQGAYADLLDHVNDISSNTVPDLFSTNIAAWPRVRDSWKKLTESYPTPYNLNRYAAMACQARDRETFQTVFGMIGRRIVPEAWTNNLSVDVCRKRFLQST